MTGWELRWHALTVTHRHERAASSHLLHKGLEGFSPVYRARRRWSDRVKELEVALFPGYVFCRFAPHERGSVLMTPGVTSIVSFGKTPGIVEDQEIAAVRTILASGLPAQPWPYLQAGQKVRVEQGCLQGLTGTLVRCRDDCRVVVNVELLQRSVAVEIDRSSLGPVAA
jgi:transcription antitermination factor NusG